MMNTFGLYFSSIMIVQWTAAKDEIPSILVWTEFFESQILHTHLKSRLVAENCPKECNFVPRSQTLRETDFDAIIFHSRDMKFSDLPRSRNTNQLYFLFSLEAPGSRGENLFSKFPPNFFNGTIGYSQLNNYTFNYDYPILIEPKLTEEFVRSKTSSVLGIISNCYSESGREVVIDSLEEHMSLTLRGNCYDEKISDYELKMLIKSHRFILALENKRCPEYVTEKGFRYKELIVPIVFSRRFAENALPSDSFIAIDDFNSTAELKEYLDRLQKDDEEYMKYFAWIKRPEYREVRSKGICKLCTDLHTSPRSLHPPLYRAAFPDDNMCILYPQRSRFTVTLVILFSIALLVIGSRLLFITYRYCQRYRNYEIVSETL